MNAEDPRVPWISDPETADAYWAEHGWDLLLDYDRAQDVPGVILPRKPFWARWTAVNDTSTVGSLVRCVELENHPPDAHKLRGILEARLERCGHTITDFEWSRSTNGWHAKLRLDPRPANPIETVALQAICGSDPLRESCNLQRARQVEAWARKVESEGGSTAAKFWRDRWNVLYRPNPERMKVKP